MDRSAEALVARGSDDALRNRIGAGRPHWAEEGLDTQALDPLHEVTTIDRVPVAQ